MIFVSYKFGPIMNLIYFNISFITFTLDYVMIIVLKLLRWWLISHYTKDNYHTLNITRLIHDLLKKVIIVSHLHLKCQLFDNVMMTWQQIIIFNYRVVRGGKLKSKIGFWKKNCIDILALSWVFICFLISLPLFFFSVRSRLREGNFCNNMDCHFRFSIFICRWVYVGFSVSLSFFFSVR